MPLVFGIFERFLKFTLFDFFLFSLPVTKNLCKRLEREKYLCSFFLSIEVITTSLELQPLQYTLVLHTFFVSLNFIHSKCHTHSNTSVIFDSKVYYIFIRNFIQSFFPIFMPMIFLTYYYVGKVTDLCTTIPKHCVYNMLHSEMQYFVKLFGFPYVSCI